MLEAKEVLLRCTTCQSERPFTINMAQFRQLAEGRPLQFHCSYCSSPQYWEMARPIDPAEMEKPQAASPKNILVVDDDDLTLKLLRKVLEAW
ncbi:MAG: hypothetical protein HY647_02515, partial [Acidobacteria bacterium]|nr:hypothetical protein [Acidobacteriota bacterium]